MAERQVFCGAGSFLYRSHILFRAVSSEEGEKTINHSVVEEHWVPVQKWSLMTPNWPEVICSARKCFR